MVTMLVAMAEGGERAAGSGAGLFVLVAIVALIAIAALVIAGYAITHPTRRFQSVNDDGEVETIEGKFASIFDLMRDLFGPSNEVSQVWTAQGMVMLLRCKKCDTKNRLRAGVEGSRCGNCHEPLSVKLVRCRKCNKRNRIKEGKENPVCGTCRAPLLSSVPMPASPKSAGKDVN